MANKVVTTNYFRELMAKKQIDLINDTFAIALMGEYISITDTSILQSIINWSEVSAYEVTAVGYNSVSLTSPTISLINESVISWDGDNIVWSGVTLNSYGYTIYRVSDGIVVGFVEFTNSPIITVNGSITIQWNSNGIMNII